jgi:hypothetical protein
MVNMATQSMHPTGIRSVRKRPERLEDGRTEGQAEEQALPVHRRWDACAGVSRVTSGPEAGQSGSSFQALQMLLVSRPMPVSAGSGVCVSAMVRTPAMVVVERRGGMPVLGATVHRPFRSCSTVTSGPGQANGLGSESAWVQMLGGFSLSRKMWNYIGCWFMNRLRYAASQGFLGV